MGHNPATGQNVATPRLWVIFGNSQKRRQIIGTHRRSILHAPRSSQMPYTAKINKINNSTNKIINPLELRLATGLSNLAAGPCFRLRQESSSSCDRRAQPCWWGSRILIEHNSDGSTWKGHSYSACHNYTGVGQILKLVFGTPGSAAEMRLSNSDTWKW